MRDRIIFTIDTKGVKRWEILSGKWLGVMVLDVALLVCLGGVIYGMVIYLARPIEGREKEQFVLRSEVLTARVETKPEVSEDVTSYVVSPQHEKEWTFRNIAPASREKTVTVKFKNYTANKSRSEIIGVWTVGNEEQGFYQQVTAFPGGAFHEFQAPASLISPEGILNVNFRNTSPGYVSVIFPVDDVMLLYRAGGFGTNFLRAMLLILLRLAFIAVVGFVSSTFLTFPVATVFSIFILVMCLSLPSLQNLLGQGPVLPEAGLSPTAVTSTFAKGIGSTGLKLLPDLRSYDPVPYLLSGLLIRWQQILRGFVGIVLVRCGLIGVIGYIVFNRRELANMGYL